MPGSRAAWRSPPARRATSSPSASSASRRAEVYLRHILPNIAATLIVSATLAFPDIILLESGLSFLGLGVQPPMSSLGNMVGYGRAYISSAPWIMLAPSLVIVLTTYSISVVGDWLRDVLDPTLS